MMHDILMVGIGAIGGSALMIFLMALLFMSKQTEVESEKLASFKAGYEKGFDEGYESAKKPF